MNTDFLTYQSFDNPELLQQFTDLLNEHQIAFFVQEDKFSFDPGFRTNGSVPNKFDVKVHPDDFEKINSILNTEDISIEEIEDDYYLFSFTDEELIEILEKADEWSNHDYLLARQILSKRGIDFSDESLQEIGQERIVQLRKPEPVQSSLINIGYMTVFLGGVLGIFIGWHLKNHKRTLPNGEQIFAYTDADRRQGNYIFILGIIVFIICLFLRFYLVSA